MIESSFAATGFQPADAGNKHERCREIHFDRNHPKVRHRLFEKDV